MKPEVGQPLISFAYPRVPGATLDARGAAAECLRAFLAGLTFYRDAGNEPSTRFALEKVYETWPQPDQPLVYPCASVTDAGRAELEGHNFVPTSLDETEGMFCPDTVLWKTDELASELQVDFFVNDEPTAQAVMATLPGAFSPDENRSGVVVQGTPRYFDRPVRLTLLSYRRNDTAGAVFDRERRVVCRVAAEVDVVVLRKVAHLRPQITVAVRTHRLEE